MSSTRFTVRKLSVVSMFVIFMLVFATSPAVYAEDDVFSFFEGKEDGTDIVEKEDQEEEQPTTEETGDTESTVGLSVWNYVKTGFALVFVIALLIGLLRFMNRKNRIYDKSRFMKNMGGISLGQQKSIQLVTIGDSYYLIGVGEDIRLLKEITDADEIASLLAFYEEGDVQPTSGWLQQILSKFQKNNEATKQTDAQTADFSQVFNSRLDEIKEERKRHISQLTEKERKHDE